MPPKDQKTLDLFDWEPPQVVERFEPERVKAFSIKNVIAKGVAATCDASSMKRDEIAAGMSEFLGETISVNMLNAYASEAREDHTIPFYRLMALVKVTGDKRLLQLGTDMVDASVIDNTFLTWVEVGQLAAKRTQVKAVGDHLDKEFETVLRMARRGVSGGRS